MRKTAREYLRRIETCTSRNEIEAIRIGFSEDCSNYKIDWDEFMTLYYAQQAKRKEIRGER